MKVELLAKLEQHLAELIAFQKQIKSTQAIQIRRPEQKAAAIALARRWFDELAPALKLIDVTAGVLDPASSQFAALLKVTRAASTKNTYLQLLADIIDIYKSNIIHTIEISPEKSEAKLSISPYLSELRADEGAYLAEAQRCLSVDGIRACIVMGWCATVSRLHDKIAEIGFSAFNKASEDMAAKQFGRFKPFNKKFKVESVSELRRTVFDTDLLWILEYLQLIDSNQHERLRHCFELRNNSAHPGQAPISGENLYSFYSDITKIVLKNPKFRIESTCAEE